MDDNGDFIIFYGFTELKNCDVIIKTSVSPDFHGESHDWKTKKIHGMFTKPPVGFARIFSTWRYCGWFLAQRFSTGDTRISDKPSRVYQIFKNRFWSVGSSGSLRDTQPGNLGTLPDRQRPHGPRPHLQRPRPRGGGFGVECHGAVQSAALAAAATGSQAVGGPKERVGV